MARDSLYAEEKLIKFYANGKYGLKDYDGKIAVAPKYDSIGNVVVQVGKPLDCRARIIEKFGCVRVNIEILGFFYHLVPTVFGEGYYRRGGLIPRPSPL